MMRLVLGMLTLAGSFVLFAGGPLSAEEKGSKKGQHHEATIVSVDAKGHKITVEVHEKGGKKGKHKTYHLVESVKIVDAKGKTTKIDVFKKGDHVKIVEHEGKVHEVHHKGGKK